MNIVSHNCLGGYLYNNVMQIPYENPFIWTVIDYKSMFNLITCWDTIDFTNYTLEKDYNWNFYIVIDDLVKVQFVHYKFDPKATKIVGNREEVVGDTVYYCKIWEYIAEKYNSRLKRMLDKNEKPLFCICNFKTDFNDACYTTEQLNELEKFNNVLILRCETLSPLEATKKFYETYKTKLMNTLSINGVLGVLKTARGIVIRDEILEHLKEHNFLKIEQDVQGNRAEYPAIKYAIKMAIDTDEPVLYLHTKGAANSVPTIQPGRVSFADFMPANATLKDWQPCVRKMWYNEFGKNIDKYLDAVKGNTPIVACPYTGPGKATWQNGFVMNPAAAHELNKIFKFTNNRYWYEVMFGECDKVEVKGLINDKICYPMDDSRFEMYKSIWSFL